MYLPVSCFSTNFDMMERNDVNVVAFSSSATGTAIVNAIKLITAIEPTVIQMYIIIIKLEYEVEMAMTLCVGNSVFIYSNCSSNGEFALDILNDKCLGC